MDTNFWLERWENRQIGFHQEQVNPCLERFWPTLEQADGSRVLVPLCGKSRDMHWLLQQGCKVIGSELSPLAVKDFFFESGRIPQIKRERRYTRWRHDDGIEILCGDFFSLGRADVGPIDAFYDRASLVALTPAQRALYARVLAALVGKGTSGLLISLDYNQTDLTGPPFAVAAAEIDRLFSDSFEIELLFAYDALEENPKFRERGLAELTGHVYRMRRY